MIKNQIYKLDAFIFISIYVKINLIDEYKVSNLRKMRDIYLFDTTLNYIMILTCYDVPQL